MAESSRQPKLFISTGCSSSDVLAAPLLEELVRRGAVGQILAMGGEPLRDHGAELLFDSTPLSTIGTAHGAAMLIRRGVGLMHALKQLKQDFQENPPDLAILVDNAGINFRVLSIARRFNVPVLYYVPPELWSVWSVELMGLKKAKPRIAAIFQSQAEEYRNLGMPTDWIGHPILDLIPEQPPRNLDFGDRPVIGLFPGSRRQEVKQLIDPMREAAQLLRREYPKAEFVICAANPLAQRIIRRDLPNWNVPVEVKYRQSHAVLKSSDFVLACSGTVTLEAALLGVPLVAMYRLGGIMDNLFQKLVLPLRTYRYFSLPNILLGDCVVPELGNRDVTGEKICATAMQILANPSRRQKMLERMSDLRRVLGEPGAIRRAADIAEEMIQHSTAGRAANRQAA